MGKFEAIAIDTKRISETRMWGREPRKGRELREAATSAATAVAAVATVAAVAATETAEGALLCRVRATYSPCKNADIELYSILLLLILIKQQIQTEITIY